MKSSLPSQLEPAAEIARHTHVGAYATLVLSGSYEEAGDAGRFRVEPGDVLIHAAFATHRDLVSPSRTIVLDLPLPFDGRAWASRGRLADPDTVLRVARRDAAEAAQLLIEDFSAGDDAEMDLPDMLARELSEDPSLPVAGLADKHGVSRETAWRHFRSAYGVDVATYRSEARARRAWRMIVGGGAPLAGIAAEAGFSDQAHMSRGVKTLTGRTPGQWRRAATSVQDGVLAQV